MAEQYLGQFNSFVNSGLDKVFNVPYFGFSLKVMLALYASLAGPQLPESWGPILTNSYFRIGMMALLIWVFNHDPSVATVIAVTYFMLLSHVMQQHVTKIAATGVVTPAAATMLSGGSGPGIKSAAEYATEAAKMTAAAAATKAPGVVTSTSPLSHNAASSAVAGYVPNHVDDLAVV